MVDFEKAFDKIWRLGLLYKLHHYEITSYIGKWLQNYLQDKTFTVSYNEALSAQTPCKAGEMAAAWIRV